MELLDNDLHSATVKLTRNEFLSISKMFSAVYQEYDSIDPQILEMSKELISELSDDFHVMLQRMIDNTNRVLQSR